METRNGIPTQRRLEQIVLECMKGMDLPATKPEIGRAAADRLDLDQEARNLKDPDRKMPLIDWKCGWALSALKRKGAIVQPARGVFGLAPKNGNGEAGANRSRPRETARAISADSAYRFFIDPERGGRCFEDGRMERMVALCEEGKRPKQAAREAKLEKQEENYVTYLIHTHLPDLVQDARIAEGKPIYTIAPQLRVRFSSQPGRLALVERLVTAKYGEKEQALEAAARAKPAGTRKDGGGESEAPSEELRALREQCDRIERKVDQLLEMWAE